MEVDKDHIHLLIDYEPSMSVGQEIWKHNRAYMKKHFWAKDILWSNGYFACSVGEASTATIQKYIGNQG